MAGYFITVEGTDGVGKTTQIKHIVSYLEQQGYSVLLTREPGGTLLGEKIRSILLDPENRSLCSRAELLLYAAARAQHLDEKIIPALQEGKLVLCDRFLDSTVAYQGYGRELGVDLTMEMNALATGDMVPDLTIYLALSPEDAIKRKAKQENHILDRMEQEENGFQERVYEGYQELWKKEPNRIRRIDALGSEEEVFLRIQKTLDRFLGRL